MTTPNVDLIRRVMAHIREHPETWDQGEWVSECRTRGCFAGWAVLLTYGPNHWFGNVGYEAEILLGLTHAQGDVLFDSTAHFPEGSNYCGGYDSFQALVTEVTGVTFS